MSNFISLERAAQLTSNYRKQKQKVLAGDFRMQGNILPVCETFGREAFDKVLAQDGCTGLRIYFGMDENNMVKALIVGVDKEGYDIIPVAKSTTRMMASATTTEGELTEETEEGGIIDNGIRCPTVCPPTSPLNG